MQHAILRGPRQIALCREITILFALAKALEAGTLFYVKGRADSVSVAHRRHRARQADPARSASRSNSQVGTRSVKGHTRR